MSDRITISPVTRIEGHLGVKVEVEAGRVTRAFVAGEMFRGFEVLLRGRTRRGFRVGAGNGV
jgi:hydrogenase large subunit